MTWRLSRARTARTSKHNGLELTRLRGLLKGVMTVTYRRDAELAPESGEDEDEHGNAIPERFETARPEPEEKDIGNVLEELGDMSKTINGRDM